MQDPRWFKEWMQLITHVVTMILAAGLSIAVVTYAITFAYWAAHP